MFLYRHDADGNPGKLTQVLTSFIHCERATLLADLNRVRTEFEYQAAAAAAATKEALGGPRRRHHASE
ncbi:hypothetical protein CHLRE_05g230971v5 [Chlamydomonas reinhardtii]|uniref:Uncharacterized protein n=1 Tax=Chlamydomonas reinhardtii TaxID=3055 RepID=A0A2K3DRY4_CHLRE|nr:uncharacterized protein CHLRE_05g230971v5 [Chlamydomonas reinhardtii]PNW83301.1 hypothetical protein CHLRE_05g230971v5 [Chlamydomonas reinhardtii]